MTDIDSETLLPINLEGLMDVSRFLDHVNDPAVLVGPDGETVPLPLEVFHALKAVVHAMRQGKAISVIPVDQQLTTQEAADFLGISRPTLVKMLERGEIPFVKVAGGRHRRVSLEALLEYQQALKERRRRLLHELVAEAHAEEMYDAGTDDYREALKSARKESAQRGEV